MKSIGNTKDGQGWLEEKCDLARLTVVQGFTECQFGRSCVMIIGDTQATSRVPRAVTHYQTIYSA